DVAAAIAAQAHRPLVTVGQREVGRERVGVLPHVHGGHLPPLDGDLDRPGPDANAARAYSAAEGRLVRGTRARMPQTMVSASKKIVPDILDWPTRRSTNLIGTSTTRKPERRAR